MLKARRPSSLSWQDLLITIPYSLAISLLFYSHHAPRDSGMMSSLSRPSDSEAKGLDCTHPYPQGPRRVISAKRSISNVENARPFYIIQRKGVLNTLSTVFIYCEFTIVLSAESWSNLNTKSYFIKMPMLFVHSFMSYTGI